MFSDAEHTESSSARGARLLSLGAGARLSIRTGARSGERLTGDGCDGLEERIRVDRLPEKSRAAVLLGPRAYADLLSAGRDDDRRRDAVVAKASLEFDTRHSWQLDVDDHAGCGRSRRSAHICLRRIEERRVEPAGSQQPSERDATRRIVFDDGDDRRSPGGHEHNVRHTPQPAISSFGATCPRSQVRFRARWRSAPAPRANRSRASRICARDGA